MADDWGNNPKLTPEVQEPGVTHVKDHEEAVSQARQVELGKCSPRNIAYYR